MEKIGRREAFQTWEFAPGSSTELTNPTYTTDLKEILRFSDDMPTETCKVCGKVWEVKEINPMEEVLYVHGDEIADHFYFNGANGYFNPKPDDVRIFVHTCTCHAILLVKSMISIGETHLNFETDQGNMEYFFSDKHK
jgi:hypothetical protein